LGRLDGKRKAPPRRARRHKPATTKFLLLLGKRGINRRGRSPSGRATSGRLAFEPRKMPATQAQPT